MTITVVIEGKTVRVEDNDIKNILSYLNTALAGAGLISLDEKNSKGDSELKAGEQKKREGWWVNLVTVKLESVTGSSRGSKESQLERISVDLDPPAYALREAYVDYLNVLFQENDKQFIGIFTRGASETEVSVIKDRVVLTRELLIRMVTIALCTDQTKKRKREGGAIVKAIRSFCSALTTNGVLNEYFLMMKKISNIDISFETDHIRWLKVLEGMVTTVNSLHAHSIALKNTLNHLIETKQTIVRQIIAMLAPDISPQSMSENWVRHTLSVAEKKLLSDKDNAKSKVLGISSLIDWSETEVSERQRHIIFLKEKEYPRLKKLYELFADTNLVLEAVSQVDTLFTATGWVLLLTGVLNVANLAKLVEDHGAKCSEILDLRPDDHIFKTKAGKGLIQYHAGSGYNIMTQAGESSKNLVALSDQRLLREIGKIISKHISGLLQLQPKLKYEIFNTEKLNVLQETTFGQQMFGNNLEGENKRLSATGPQDIAHPQNNPLKTAQDINQFFSHQENTHIKLSTNKEIVIEGVNDRLCVNNHGFSIIIEEDSIAKATNVYTRAAIVALLKENIAAHRKLRDFISREIETLYRDFNAGVQNYNVKKIPVKVLEKFSYFKIQSTALDDEYARQLIPLNSYKPEKKQKKLHKLKKEYDDKCEKFRKTVWEYCCRDKVVAEYLDKLLSDENTVPTPEGSLALFAQILQVKIHLYQAMPPDESHNTWWLKTVELQQHFPHDFKKEIILLRNADNSKYFQLYYRVFKFDLGEARARSNSVTALVPAAARSSSPLKVLLRSPSVSRLRNERNEAPANKPLIPEVRTAGIFSLFSGSNTEIIKLARISYQQVLHQRRQKNDEDAREQRLRSLKGSVAPQKIETLLQACQANNLESAKAFLAAFKKESDRKTAINICDPKLEKNAFHFALLNGNVELITLLYQSGADSSIVDKDGFNAMHYLVKNLGLTEENIKSLLKMLYQKNPELLHARVYGKTMLHIAADSGNLHAFKWLIEEYSQNFVQYINLPDYDEAHEDNCTGFTPLHFAAAKGYVEMIIMLLRINTINPLAKDRQSKSAVFHAILGGHVHIAELFFQGGAWVTKNERVELDQIARETSNEKEKQAILACLAIPTLEAAKLEMPELATQKVVSP